MELTTSKFIGSHIPLLMKLLLITEGDILEIGTGIFSTPFLHWFCFVNKDRHLVSLENSKEYIDFAKEYEDEFHEVYLVESYKDKDVGNGWGVIFIDSMPLEQREYELTRLANSGKYLVVHDTIIGMYDGIFKYRFDYTDLTPHTTIFSNFVDVNNLKL